MYCEFTQIPPDSTAYEIRLFDDGKGSFESGGGNPYEWSALVIIGKDGIPEVKLVDKPLTLEGRKALREAFLARGYTKYRRVYPSGRSEIKDV